MAVVVAAVGSALGMVKEAMIASDAVAEASYLTTMKPLATAW